MSYRLEDGACYSLLRIVIAALLVIALRWLLVGGDR